MSELAQNVKLLYSTKQEQVDASVRFVLQDDKEYYESLNHLPKRVEAAILKMVLEWENPSGYHFHILRAAYRQYVRDATITVDEPPFTTEELA